jgi:hypothetical protein
MAFGYLGSEMYRALPSRQISELNAKQTITAAL